MYFSRYSNRFNKSFIFREARQMMKHRTVVDSHSLAQGSHFAARGKKIIGYRSRYGSRVSPHLTAEKLSSRPASERALADGNIWLTQSLNWGIVFSFGMLADTAARNVFETG
jgi:hypothetical protein